MRAPRVIVPIVILAALSLAACGENEPFLRRVPGACILITKAKVHKETGDLSLKAVTDEEWNTLGGNSCVFTDPGQPAVRWSFEIDPDPGPAQQRAAQSYKLTPATEDQLGGGNPEGVYTLSHDAKTVGLFAGISGGAAVIITGPADDVSPAAVYRLAQMMSDANAAQGAAGVAGQ